MAITYNTAIERIVSLSRRNTAGVWSVVRQNTAVEFDYFEDTDTADAAIYFSCHCHKFSGLELDIKTAITATDLVLVWEYRKYDNTWVALSDVVDGTAQFTNTGVQSVTWTVPTDWATGGYLVSTATTGYLYTWGFQVRCRISSVTSLSEGGRNNATKVKDYCNGIYIGDGGSYTVDDIVTADTAGGWGVITKDTSGNSYFLSCSLLIHNGTLTLDGWRTLVVGKTGITTVSPTASGSASDGAVIELFDDGTLTMGKKDGYGFGYYGAKLILNSCTRSMVSNQTGGYWGGTLNMYGSQFITQGIGGCGLSIASKIDILDSLIETIYRQPLYFQDKSVGTMSRTSINTSSFYCYTGNVTFSAILFGRSNSHTWQYLLSGGNNARISDTYLASVEQVYVSQASTFDILDCRGIPTKTCADNYAQYEYLNEMYTFGLKVVDEAGDPIEGATVTLKDKNGNTALFEDSFVWSNGSINYIYNLTSISDTSASCSTSSYTNVGDYLRVGGEIIKVTAKPSSTTYTVERNQTGTFARVVTATTAGRVPAFRLNESGTTDANGELKNNTTYDYIVLYEQTGRISNVSTVYSLYPFTLTIAKDGYETYTAELTINTKTALTITLKSVVKNRKTTEGRVLIANKPERGSSSILAEI